MLVDALLIITNALVVLSSIVAAFVTLADVNKEDQMTLRDVFKEAINPKAVKHNPVH